jgi:hypothetical protein
MTIYQQLQDQNATRPFKPFWIRLADGETIHITRPNQAVVMPKQFVFTPDRKRLKWIPLDRIASSGALPTTDGKQTEDRK